MKKVYAVSSGIYSDYRINAIFSTKKKAEEFMTLVPEPDYNNIEEYELNPSVVDLIKRGYSIWRVYMLIDGTIEKIEEDERNVDSVIKRGHHIWRRTQSPTYKGKGIPDVLISKVWAKTEDAAIKITNEYRTQLIGTGIWK